MGHVSESRALGKATAHGDDLDAHHRKGGDAHAGVPRGPVGGAAVADDADAGDDGDKQRHVEGAVRQRQLSVGRLLETEAWAQMIRMSETLAAARTRASDFAHVFH